MTQLLIYREKVIRFFKEYETWFIILAKFLGMMLVFSYINEKLGFYELLGSMPVNVLLSLICSIIPGSFVIIIVAAVIAAHMLKFSMMIGLLTIAVMVIIYLLFLSFAPKYALVLLAAPVLVHYNLGFALPVIAGLLFTPYAAIPAAAGLFMVSFLRAAVQYGGELGGPAGASGAAALVDSLDPEKITTVVTQIFTQAFADKTFVLLFVLVLVTAAVMFIINRFSISYIWYFSIAVGVVVELLCAILAGPRIPGSDMSGLLTGVLVGGAAAVIIQFFRCVVDYKSRESLQFEDEEYYYYVQAIPKYLADGASYEPVEEKFPKKEDIVKIADSVKHRLPSGKKSDKAEE